VAIFDHTGAAVTPQLVSATPLGSDGVLLPIHRRCLYGTGVSASRTREQIAVP
jgi:hypothetical protein